MTRRTGRTPFLAATVPCLLLTASCGGDSTGPEVRPFELNESALEAIWIVSNKQELACSGALVAGGEVGGQGDFSELGQTGVDVSAAWDTGSLLGAGSHTPVGPVGGPVAPVLGQADYPYDFTFDPFTGSCGQTVSATGKMVLTAGDGDQIFGDVVGGEAHRLDFVVEGDGVETFADVVVTGGTGRFANATGAFTVHIIVQVDVATLEAQIPFAEILPGGTLAF